MSINNNNNTDFMAWNSPGSGGQNNDPNRGSQEGRSQEPKNQNGGFGYRPEDNQQDPWGRTNRNTTSGGFDDLLKTLKKFMNKGNKGGFGSGGDGVELYGSDFSVVRLYQRAFRGCGRFGGAGRELEIGGSGEKRYGNGRFPDDRVGLFAGGA